MEGQIFVSLILLIASGRSSASRCDIATTARIQEGTFGQSSDFNWLGVLNVHIHDGKKVRIALSGIILIKFNYALASADDVSRIPKHTFISDSKAMFLPTKDSPLYVGLVNFVTHPEYEYSTLNSIAIIELDLENVDDYPLNPICLPTSETFNASSYLFLTGYTDENKKLEKVIHKIQFLSKSTCEEFYNRAGLSSQQRIPSTYTCGYAPNNKKHCVWDNGMALVSNVTGFFYLIGFGVRGPGCAAPARFIDLFPYFYWIETNTSPDEIEEFDVPEDWRRRHTGSRRQKERVGHHESTRDTFDTKILKNLTIESKEDIKTTKKIS